MSMFGLSIRGVPVRRSFSFGRGEAIKGAFLQRSKLSLENMNEIGSGFKRVSEDCLGRGLYVCSRISSIYFTEPLQVPHRNHISQFSSTHKSTTHNVLLVG